jgi:hypothetical protein
VLLREALELDLNYDILLNFLQRLRFQRSRSSESSEVVFLVVCDRSVNEHRATQTGLGHSQHIHRRATHN